jgi:hypothetical protein
MNSREDLLRSLLAGLDREEQQNLLNRLELARQEQLRAKRQAPAPAE